MSIHGIGIIGYGGFGRFLHNSWQKMDSVKITAVADEIVTRKPAPPVRFYNRWQDLVADDQVDIVSIATPPNTHAQIACGALQAGKNVLIEKPIATNIEDGRKIVELCSRTGQIATVDYMLRFNPIVEALGVLSRDKVFGELRHVNVENYAQDQGLGPEHWFWDREISGGILIEHAVHFIDVVHSLTSQRYKSVAGFGHNRNEKQQDQVWASVLYDGGLIATHYHSFARPGFFEDTSMRLNYDLAQIDVRGWIPLAGRLTALFNRETRQRLSQLPGLKVEQSVSVRNLEDVSRPKGWGPIDQQPDRQSRLTIRSGGVEYNVEEMVVAKFDIGKAKHKVYTGCVQAILNDLITKRENPTHQLRVTIEDGLSSLEVAYLATQSADMHK